MHTRKITKQHCISVEFKRAKKEEVQKIHLSLNGEFDMSLREFFSNMKCIQNNKRFCILM